MKAQLLDIIMYSETKYCIVQYIPLMGMVTQLKSCTTHSSVNLGSVLCDLLVSHYRIDTQHTVFLVAKPNEGLVDRQCTRDLIRITVKFSMCGHSAKRNLEVSQPVVLASYHEV